MATQGILISVLILVLILVGIFIFLKRKEKHEPDYYTLFILGIVFFIIGITGESVVMWILGLAFFLVGLTNKSKLKKKKKKLPAK